MLYATIVRRKIKRTFRDINQGDIQPMLDTLADPFVYIFHGTHALGGRRTSKSAMRLWWERVFRLLPGIRFDVQEVVISGWPWNMRVAVRSLVSGDLPNGELYSNTAFQFMKLRWGRITRIETMEDTQLLEQALRVVAESGYVEALEPPVNG